MEMDRNEAIEYLERKGRLSEDKHKRKFTKLDEINIREVQREGKIYGDPIVELNSI